jgi:WD40 repeat protein
MFEFATALEVSPEGSYVVMGTGQGEVVVLPIDGNAPRTLRGFTDAISWVGVSPGGRTVAAGSGLFISEQALIRIWDLESGETTILDAGDRRGLTGFQFLPDGNIWAYSQPIARLWDLAGPQPSIVEEYDLSGPGYVSDITMDFDPAGRRALLIEKGEGSNPVGASNRVWIQNLVTHEAVELEGHRGMSGYFGWDIDLGAVITNQRSGDVLVGPITGGEPHLLLGHETRLNWAAFSPDGQWIATGDEDGVIRLWPMPDLSKPPLHTLPHSELVAKLRTLTNLRVVRDPESATGWKLTHDPFPGWETVPTW